MLMRVQQEDSEVQDVEDIPSGAIVERIEFKCEGRIVLLWRS